MINKLKLFLLNFNQQFSYNWRVNVGWDLHKVEFRINWISEFKWQLKVSNNYYTIHGFLHCHIPAANLYPSKTNVRFRFPTATFMAFFLTQQIACIKMENKYMLK